MDTNPLHRKYGSITVDESGTIVELFGKVKLGDFVTWRGRKIGRSTDDSQFVSNQQYKVCFIYTSNRDIEIEQYIDGKHITIRASESEYSTK